MKHRPRIYFRVARPWIIAASLYAIVATAMLYPLIVLAGTAVSFPNDDPLLNTWISWWNAAIFYPTAGVMAFSELLLGLLPITAPVQWLSHDPLLAYNVAVIVSF